MNLIHVPYTNNIIFLIPFGPSEKNDSNATIDNLG